MSNRQNPGRKAADISQEAEIEAPSRSGSATDKVTEAIIQGIRTGHFVPGQHLLEPDLSRLLQISRGSLREALKHLAADGIVTLNRFRGAYISLLDKQSVLDLLAVLQPLAWLAARLAAEHCTTEENKQAIREAAAQLEQAYKSGNRVHYLESRHRFYDMMIEIGGNQELKRVMPITRTDLVRAQVEPIQSAKQQQKRTSDYTRIAAAIAAENPDLAGRLINRHFDETRKIMASKSPESFLNPIFS